MKIEGKFIFKVAGTLTAISLVVALLLGLTNMLTADKIAAINQQKTEEALAKVVSAADCEFPPMEEIPQAMIDAANLRALVRAERMHMDPGFLQEVLFEGGSVTPDAIRAGASEPAALFRSTALREAAELGEAAVKGGSLTDFEKACDNAVLRTAAGARRVPFGVEVALGYLIAKEAEWTAVRIVMAGRLAGLSADAIRERLRDTYV